MPQGFCAVIILCVKAWLTPRHGERRLGVPVTWWLRCVMALDVWAVARVL